MSNDERIKNLEAFVHSQKYVAGLAFRILENDDEFVIEFEVANKRHLFTINRLLSANDMLHIRAKAKKVIEFQPPKFKHHGRGKKKSH